jgi:hypothetical protein
MKKVFFLIVGVFVVGMFSTASASLLTSNTIANSTVVDFSTQPTVVDVPGPLQVGMLVGENIEVSSPGGQLYANYDGWGLSPNGEWGPPKTYVSQDEDPGTMIITFHNGPVSVVGGFMSYYNADQGSGLVITALNAGMGVLESYDILVEAPIIAPEFNGGAFRGIDRGGVADIAHLQITGAYPTLDDLTFTRGSGTQGIPTLSVWGLVFLTGLLGFVAYYSRRRNNKSNYSGARDTHSILTLD